MDFELDNSFISVYLHKCCDMIGPIFAKPKSAIPQPKWDVWTPEKSAKNIWPFLPQFSPLKLYLKNLW